MMEKLIERLHSEQCSCVIAQGDNVRTFHRSGIMDLFLTLKNEPELLRGALIADKVVGKAAAALMVLGGVSRVYADNISAPAVAMLQDHGIAVSYANIAHHIINRAGTGWCPMEELSRDDHEPEVIRRKVEDFLRGKTAACCNIGRHPDAGNNNDGRDL